MSGNKKSKQKYLKRFIEDLEIGHPMGHLNLTLVPLGGQRHGQLHYTLAMQAIKDDAVEVAVMVREALRGAALDGARTERVRLSDLSIAPCRACEACARTGECVIRDDFQPLLAKVLEADRPEAWCEAIGRILDDSALRRRLGQAARACTEQRFNWDRRMADLVGLCRRLVSAPVTMGSAAAGLNDEKQATQGTEPIRPEATAR